MRELEPRYLNSGRKLLMKYKGVGAAITTAPTLYKNIIFLFR